MSFFQQWAVILIVGFGGVFLTAWGEGFPPRCVEGEILTSVFQWDAEGRMKPAGKACTRRTGDEIHLVRDESGKIVRR